MARFIVFRAKVGRIVLLRILRDELILRIIAKPFVHSGIVLSELRQFAIMIDVRTGSLAIPICITLYTAITVKEVKDRRRSVIANLLVGLSTFVRVTCSTPKTVTVPRCSPYPFGKPNRTTMRVSIDAPIEAVPYSVIPLSMEINDIAAPTTLVNSIHELVVPVPPAIVSGW